MLGYYIKSTIVFLIIYFASNRAIRILLQNRDEIDYKKYTKKDNKGIWYTFFKNSSISSNVLVNGSF